MASNSLLSNKYFNSLDVNKLKVNNLNINDDGQIVNTSENLDIPLLWRLLEYKDKNGVSMAKTMLENHEWIDLDGNYKKPDDSLALTWSQFVSTFFFTNKYEGSLYNGFERLFSVYGTLVPQYSEICPGVAVFSTILQGYFNDYIYDNLTFYNSLPNYDDIVSKSYLQLSNLVENVLSIESELGLDPRLEDLQLQPHYLFFFYASLAGVELMNYKYNSSTDTKAYFDKQITWERFYTQMKEGFTLAEEFDKICPFRYDKSKGYGIGQGLKLIISGHWHNSLSAVGLIKKAKVKGTIYEEYISITSDDDEYYIEPVLDDVSEDLKLEIQNWLNKNSLPTGSVVPPGSLGTPMSVSMYQYSLIEPGFDKLNNWVNKNVSSTSPYFTPEKMSIANLWLKYQNLEK